MRLCDVSKLCGCVMSVNCLCNVSKLFDYPNYAEAWLSQQHGIPNLGIENVMPTSIPYASAEPTTKGIAFFYPSIHFIIDSEIFFRMCYQDR